jgi:hypothetical protein
MLRWKDLVIGVVVAGVAVGPAARVGALAGSSGAEVYGHAWVQSWAAAQWPAWPTGTTMAAGSSARAIIDPLPTWLVGGLSQLIGPTAAWNAWIAASIVLAALGGAALARVTRGVPEVGAIGLATAPIFLGSLTSGLTEDGAIGLVALALAAQRERRGVLAGALLGMAAFCGLYVAWLGGVAAAALGAWQLWQALQAQRHENGRATGGPEAAPDVRRAAPNPGEHDRGGAPAEPADGPGFAHVRPARFGGAPGSAAEPPLRRVAFMLATAACIAAVGAFVASEPFRSRLDGAGHRTASRGAPPPSEPLWRANPWRGADLATFLAPGDPDTRGAYVREHPVYLGYTTLALAATVPSPAWIAVLACATVAPGEQLAWMGRPLGVTNPAIAAFRALPLADRFNHHARVMLLGQLVLVTLAARGAARSARVATLAPLALTAEALLLAPSRLPLPATSADTPAIYAALSALPEGPVSVSGAAGPGIHPQELFFDQRAHGRRLLHSPDRPSDGAPTPGAVFVVLGDPGSARVRETVERLGLPTVATADGAAWWVPPAP